ncbi:fumarylacetoacetate hydrolase family protein [Rathayibacter soli]|uniref:fumarylacetoacetate hydrolase family protein n=1 Tax=Rathayibacter soli TaxID=3144168 RepID=UPI0027E586D3|nr:fumarylacetoacetate hydrolase family protein [Glaciibacter superstes]
MSESATTGAAPSTSSGNERRPGKIIAVHLNYRSRAEQRGRTPAQPSYFLKPATSVAASGGTLERPAGTELLAFEGEIALIIGRTTRRVSPGEGWAAVSGVTAANDFGVYDFRVADKGSNLRSKGGDGFTPLGPVVIPAEGIDPAALRVRTWVNGELVQDDSSSGLLFPFARLVADLSQLLTLEPGDVILTGTPAGSSVVQPGDVVEVEVDAPTAPGAPTSGRLRTTIAQGTVPFGDFGAQPSVDETQRAEAWGVAAAGVAHAGLDTLAGAHYSTTEKREDAGVDTGLDTLAGARYSTTDGGARYSTTEQPVFVLTDEWRAKLAETAVATLSASLRKRGYHDIFIEGVHSNKPGAHLAGLARTLRFIPFRPDLFASHGAGYNAQKRAFDAVNPGEVLVIEARGELGTGTVGDVLALRAQVRGAAGIVTDGGVRDYDVVAELEIPTFSKGPHPSVLGRKHVPWETDLTIDCGGAAVQPGDLIVGDGDGVIVIPAAIAAEVIDEAHAKEREDAWVAEQVAAGAAVDGLFPMNAEWKARYAQWLQQQ